MNEIQIIMSLLNDNPAMLSMVEAVTGGLFTALFFRNNTLVKEFEKIKAGQFGKAAEELLSNGKMTYMEYQKTKNFLEIAKKADMYYSEKRRENQMDQEEFDWYVRFFETAGNISDHMIQELWARVLAGKIERSSSFSLKVIDVLRSLSKSDAELLAEVYEHSFRLDEKCVILPSSEEYLEKCNIAYADILRLVEHGLMFHGVSYAKIQLGNISQQLFINDELVVVGIATSGKNEFANIKQYQFTNAGRELTSLIEKKYSNRDLLEFCRLAVEPSPKYKISVHKIIKRNKGSVEHEKENLTDMNFY